MITKLVSLKPWKVIVFIVVGVTAIVLALSLTSYRRDMKIARDRQQSLGSQVIETACGPIEYATYGEGQPVLVVHGVVGGYDQAITTARIHVGEGFQFIAPSRFGYQNTPMPADPSPAAQADAHACLLDALNISKIPVMGISAGAPSSLQLALRHPERVSALVLNVPLAYMPEPSDAQSVAFPFILSSLLKSDYPIWAAMKLNPQIVLSTMGVPAAVQQQLEPEQKIEIMNILLPFDTRIPGVMNDGKIASNMEPFPIQNITAPTLVISAKDDLWKTYGPAEYTAQNIPNAEFVGLDAGGHLLNGREEKVRSTISAFLKKASS